MQQFRIHFILLVFISSNFFVLFCMEQPPKSNAITIQKDKKDKTVFTSIEARKKFFEDMQSQSPAGSFYDASTSPETTSPLPELHSTLGLAALQIFSEYTKVQGDPNAPEGETIKLKKDRERRYSMRDIFSSQEAEKKEELRKLKEQFKKEKEELKRIKEKKHENTISLKETNKKLKQKKRMSRQASKNSFY